MEYLLGMNKIFRDFFLTNRQDFSLVIYPSIFQVDLMTVKETLVMIEGESEVVRTENQHMKDHFKRMENELKQTRDIVTEFNRKLEQLKNEVAEAKRNESVLNDKVNISQGIYYSQGPCSYLQDILTEKSNLNMLKV